MERTYASAAVPTGRPAPAGMARWSGQRTRLRPGRRDERVSTHRAGWQITVADLARHGRERVHAVTTGLEELQHHGFLLRERGRNSDGTLGQELYVITDLPSWLRSARRSGLPVAQARRRVRPWRHRPRSPTSGNSNPGALGTGETRMPDTSPVR